MNAEGRWPFKGQGVSLTTVHLVNKVKGKLLNVGDDYLKLKRKSQKNEASPPKVDSRFDYMLSLMSHIGGVAKEEISEDNNIPEKVDVANDFFRQTKSRHLLFIGADSLNHTSKKWTSKSCVLHSSERLTLRSTCAFFIKEISVEHLPQNVIGSSVIFLVLNACPRYVFGSLHQILDSIYLKRLRKTWCDNESGTLAGAYENLLYFLEALADGFKVAHLGVTKGLILRELPEDLLDLKEDDEFVPDEESSKLAENIVSIWKQQIEQLLTESSYLRKESELHGPRSELEYWKCRRDTFGLLIHQFHLEENRKVLDRALQSSPELQTAWMSIDARVRRSWAEAKECAAFLECLDRYCQPLYSSNPETIIKNLPSLIRTLLTINTVSQYYNSTERMTAVLTKITNQMINSCKRYISCDGSKSVWDQPEDVIKDKIATCIALNDEYQSCFYRLKAESACSPSKRDFHFCEVFVFGKFDAFCSRLRKLQKLFDCVHVHDSIISYQQEVLDELPYSLEDSVARMRGKEYDFLNYKDVQFDEDFADVMKVANEIQMLLNLSQNGNNPEMAII